MLHIFTWVGRVASDGLFDIMRLRDQTDLLALSYAL